MHAKGRHKKVGVHEGSLDGVQGGRCVGKEVCVSYCNKGNIPLRIA